jgi:hypothetical protein
MFAIQLNNSSLGEHNFTSGRDQDDGASNISLTSLSEQAPRAGRHEPQLSKIVMPSVTAPSSTNSSRNTDIRSNQLEITAPTPPVSPAPPPLDVLVKFVTSQSRFHTSMLTDDGYLRNEPDVQGVFDEIFEATDPLLDPSCRGLMAAMLDLLWEKNPHLRLEGDTFNIEFDLPSEDSQKKKKKEKKKKGRKISNVKDTPSGCRQLINELRAALDSPTIICQGGFTFSELARYPRESIDLVMRKILDSKVPNSAQQLINLVNNLANPRVTFRESEPRRGLPGLLFGRADK